MGFPDLQSSHRRSSLYEHLAIVAVFALTMVAFHVSDDPITGKGSVFDGIGGSLGFLGVAYYVGWLPSLWEIGRRKWFGSLVLPLFIALVLTYIYFVLKAYYIQPGATVLTFLIHVIVLTYLSSRT